MEKKILFLVRIKLVGSLNNDLDICVRVCVCVCV